MSKYDTFSEIHILSLFSGLVSAVQQPRACAFHYHLQVYVVVHGLYDFMHRMYSVNTSCHLDSVVNAWAEREAKKVHTFIATVIVSIYTSGFLVKSTSSLHVAILQVSDFIVVCNYKSPDVILEILNSPK